MKEDDYIVPLKNGNYGKPNAIFTIKPEDLASMREWASKLFGNTETTITDDAVQALHEASSGWPFEISMIVFNIPDNVKRIERSHIIQATKDLMQEEAAGNKKGYYTIPSSTP